MIPRKPYILQVQKQTWPPVSCLSLICPQHELYASLGHWGFEFVAEVTGPGWGSGGGLFLHLFWDHKLGCHISEGSVTFWENYWPKSQRGPTLTSSSATGLYMTWSNPCHLHSGAQISLHQLNVMVTFKLKGRSFQLWSSIRFIFLPCHLSPN